MASEHALGIAARCWCDERTKTTTMDATLAEVFAEKIDEFFAALEWCGGSGDFAPGGKAEKGWKRICLPLLEGGAPLTGMTVQPATPESEADPRNPAVPGHEVAGHISPPTT